MKKVLVSLLLGVTLVGGLVGCGNTVSQEEYDTLNSKYEKQMQYTENWKEKSEDLQGKNNELNEQVKIAKEYLELDENEKTLVDAKIDEVNKATEDQLAQEKAQKELQNIRDSISEYINLIDSKSYYDMSPEERAKVTQFIDTKFNELPEELKSEYQAKYDSAKRSKDEGVARLQAEEEARKVAEEEAKRQAEEEQRKATEYANVVKTARNYLNFMSFSRKGLIEQLVYEGYSTESAEYAVDNIGADWNQQCAKKAKDYLEFMSFSREGLYDQLAYEGFTDEQIQYGLSQVGY